MLALDDGYGDEGMSLPQLKVQIRNFVLEKESSLGFKGWENSPKSSPVKTPKVRLVHACNNRSLPLTDKLPSRSPASFPPPREAPPLTQAEKDRAGMKAAKRLSHQAIREADTNSSVTSNKKTSTSSLPFSVKVRYGDGPTPCFCCGSGEHSWIFCSKKARGKCAVCGSRAHPTRLCAQRYRPRPEVRVHMAQITPDMKDDPTFIFENMPDSDAEDDDALEVELIEESEEVEEATSHVM